MDKKSLDRITQSAQLLDRCDDATLLSGALLSAWRILQELKLYGSDDRAIRASEIARNLANRYSVAASPEVIRQVLRALREGGIEIQSARSRGYWIEPN